MSFSVKETETVVHNVQLEESNDRRRADLVF
jgi:hypothetical protein